MTPSGQTAAQTLLAHSTMTPSGQTAAQTLLDNASWCWGAGHPPPIITHHHDAFNFHREFVMTNKPCILVGLCQQWKALPETWSEVFEQALGGLDHVVECNATPNGRGDAVVTIPSPSSNNNIQVFCKPHVHENVTLRELNAFLLHHQPPPLHSHRGVLYLSQQNNSLMDAFPHFVSRGFAPSSIPFADKVFGKVPDAVNIWIGDERSISMVHRDSSYENFYCVLKGEKIFHLLPPCAAPFLRERPFRNAHYRWQSPEDKWDIELEGEETPWIEVDVADNVMMSKEPFVAVQKLVVEVHVKEGQCLYLPAGWFHRVTQSCATLAVNYWYDRDFNATWALQQAFEDAVKDKL